MQRPIAMSLALWLAGTGIARAEQFVIQPGEQSTVRFESKAKLESFSGKTQKVQGFVILDPAKLADSLEVSIEVDLASLDTGIELRNKHMRDNHLETTKYPTAVFHGAKVLKSSHPKLQLGQQVDLDIAGELEMHGVKQPLKVPVQLSLMEGDGPARVHITSEFPVKLADFKVSRPQFLILKLDEVQHVRVDLVATAKSPEH